jgi:hypothetical protein
VIRNPARHSTTITPRSLSPAWLSPAIRITAMISSQSADPADNADPYYEAVATDERQTGSPASDADQRNPAKERNS